MNENVNENRSLENNVNMLTRVKYAAIPAAITACAYFAPEIKKKYDSLPEDTKRCYKNAALWGLEISGTVVAVLAGAKLYRNYKSDNGLGTEQ